MTTSLTDDEVLTLLTEVERQRWMPHVLLAQSQGSMPMVKSHLSVNRDLLTTIATERRARMEAEASAASLHRMNVEIHNHDVDALKADLAETAARLRLSREAEDAERALADELAAALKALHPTFGDYVDASNAAFAKHAAARKGGG